MATKKMMHDIKEDDAEIREKYRLRTVDKYNILDTAPEKQLDQLTSLAAKICGTPMALISVIDEDRQWFKSNQGFDTKETPREHSFCTHAIEDDSIMVVEDATKDQRFAGNPFVVGAPDIRFYAGSPLVMENGHALGTLCVIDRKPRKLSENQLEILQILSDAAVTHLELRRALMDMKLIEGILPICAWCRNIRQPDGSWQTLYEHVMAKRRVSHSICPDCAGEIS
ncbi:GAF domain-containing protein [Halovulum dunhuangense]|uniref:GAF domain-containing protein n=2 Tax=Halovulum dunhuangense TaxID=1505036 RepID=A0A849L6K9_9RHOB|nr:GAF domain-containing protein [Halovulum dunhuangense]